MTLALVMAGGRGDRMRASTQRSTPKPLVRVRGVSLLERNLAMLLFSGFRDLVVAVPGGRDEEIARVVETRGRSFVEAFGGSIRVLTEREPLGTIGAAAELADSGRDVLVVNADNLTALDLCALVSRHRDSCAAMTVATHVQPIRVPWGEALVSEDGEWIREYREKPALPVRVSSGSYVLAPRALAAMSRGERTDAPDLVRALIARGDRVASFGHESPWIDVNDADAVVRAEALVAANTDRFEYFGRAPDVTVVGVVLRIGNDLLLEFRPTTARCYPGVWDTPGGRIEPGETPVEALVRELHEELGLEIAPREPSPLCVFDDIDSASARVFRHHVFVADVSKDIRIHARLGQELRWVSCAQIREREIAPLSPAVTRSLAPLGMETA